MIEQALREHLIAQGALAPYMAVYGGELAVFNQEAPADQDLLWGQGSQYGRIIFAVDIQGDPERTMGGMLAVDIMCRKDESAPEEIEPIVRSLIDGWFFSNGIFTVAAQWRESNYFTGPTEQVIGCTISFDLLAFPLLTTSDPDVIVRFNEWTKARFPELYVINLDKLPAAAWKPSKGESAVYWRLGRREAPRRVRSNYYTVWRNVYVQGHVFSDSNATATDVSDRIVIQTFRDKWLRKEDETPIKVNWEDANKTDPSADPLRRGQITIEATYGVIIHQNKNKTFNHIHTNERSVGENEQK